VAALDPFHDYTQLVQGLPDSICLPSYTRVHNQTLSFAATAAGDTIRVSFNGLHETTHNQRYVSNNPAEESRSVSGKYYSGPVQVIRSPASTYGNCSYGTLFSGASDNLGRLALTPDITTPSRVIAIGVEIHDTTAAIERCGSIAACMVPGVPQETSRLLMQTTVSTIAAPLTLTPALPALKSEAALIPGWVEWESSKGMYLVAKMASVPTPHHFQMTPGVNLGACPSGNHWGVITEALQGMEYWCYPATDLSSGPVQYNTTVYPSFDSGFQPWTIWLSGLAATSTFRMVLRTVVEYFPEMSDLAVLPNAVMPSPYDPLALVEYHKAATVLPTGVPVSMNPKGEWWNMVKKAARIGGNVLRSALPQVLNLAGFPVAGAIGTVIAKSLPDFGGSRPPRPNRAGSRGKGPQQGRKPAKKT
jgi:hypothetical protein